MPLQGPPLQGPPLWALPLWALPPWSLKPILLLLPETLMLLLPETMLLAGVLPASEAAAGGAAEPGDAAACKKVSHCSGGIQPFSFHQDCRQSAAFQRDSCQLAASQRNYWWLAPTNQDLLTCRVQAPSWPESLEQLSSVGTDE